MSEAIEIIRAVDAMNRLDRAERRSLGYLAAHRDFEAAQAVAEAAGLSLRRCTESHYQLSGPEGRWLQNIYPGNRRLYFDRKKTQRPPFLRSLPCDWTLADVVRLTIDALKTENAK